MLQITDFWTEGQAGHVVTDETSPEFSFRMDSDQKDNQLKKAVISMNGWSVETTKQQGIFYKGEALKPFTVYKVTLDVMDIYGETATAEMEVETGRLGTPWTAQWITDIGYEFKEKKASPKPMLFTKEFFPDEKPVSVKMYSTAFGIYEATLNGEKIGKDYFAPGFTDYRNQLQYQVYDITDMWQEQENRLAITVAGGWAVGAFTYARVNRQYAKRQSLLCEIRVTYADGSVEILGTDETWHVTEDGYYKEAEFYIGETYDANVDLGKINWKNAGLEMEFKVHPKLIAQYGLPVQAHEVFQPISCTKTKSGRLLYDMGQNMAGVISAKIKGKKGQKVIFRHAEVLMDGDLYTVPLRSAKQEATYICKDGEQTYSPRLTYMGFRYVSVEGIDEADLELTAVAVYSSIDDNGSFSCSNELINRLQENVRWGAKSNFVDIPTDCPQRDERMGWTGDIALFAPTAVYNFRMTRFLKKWLKDVQTEQRRGGGIPVTVPLVRVPMQWEIMIPMAVDHWGDACILVPWAEYKANGDVEILRQMYPTMKKYLKACKFWAELFSVGKHRYIWQLLHHYGDWVAPDTNLMGWMGRGKWTATACMAYSNRIVSQIAEILGEKEDAEFYKQFSDATSDAYRSLLLDDNCKLKREFQTGYILPLYYQMLNDEDRKTVAKNLVELIRKDEYKIKTGFPGTPYILFALADNGYVEDAYKLLLKDTCPSWLFEVKVGGTTVWERWDALREDGTCNTGEGDGTGGMVSFNHYEMGAVGDFLYRRVAGIEALEGGYKKFKIQPILGGDITYANASVGCAYGTIVSDWKIEGQKFTLDVKVPMGTTCEVILPDGQKQQVGSGSYHFECQLS